MGADFVVSDQGTIWVFNPLTNAARVFSRNELGLESWQWLGDGFAVDHRPAILQAEQLANEGWKLEAI